MVSAVLKTDPWQERWAAARAAGRTSAAIELSASVIAAHPYSPEPYFEAADFLCELQHNLASLDRLYEQHREAFGLAAEDLTWRPPQFPIARHGLTQITLLLRIACGASPKNIAWQSRLADALDRLGEVDEAIQRRVHIARVFPKFQENQWALLELLERTGDYRRASRYGESLIVDAASAPEAIFFQARIHDRLSETQIAHLLRERLRTRVSARDPNSADQIDFLFRLAWTAARKGLPPDGDELIRNLRQHCAAAAKGNFNNAKARLADGYACLIAGDTEQAKASFAIASWIISRDEERSIELPTMDAFSSAMRYARAFLVDLAPAPALSDEAPSPRNNELAFAHSYWLRKSGRFIDALTELARWLAAVPDVILPRMYNGHHIALRNGVYFGVPLSEARFTIIGGKAYRITPLALLIAKLLPARVRTLMHGLSLPAVKGAAQSSPTRTGRSIARNLLTHKWVRRTVLTLARPLLAGQSISNALQAPNLYKLFAAIDRQLIATDRRIDSSAK
jgi:tetratricopeptide (TPR) repeat protein